MSFLARDDLRGTFLLVCDFRFANCSWISRCRDALNFFCRGRLFLVGSIGDRSCGCGGSFSAPGTVLLLPFDCLTAVGDGCDFFLGAIGLAAVVLLSALFAEVGLVGCCFRSWLAASRLCKKLSGGGVESGGDPPALGKVDRRAALAPFVDLGTVAASIPAGGLGPTFRGETFFSCCCCCDGLLTTSPFFVSFACDVLWIAGAFLAGGSNNCSAPCDASLCRTIAAAGLGCLATGAFAAAAWGGLFRFVAVEVA